MRNRIIFSVRTRGEAIPFHHQHLIGKLINDTVVEMLPEEYVNYQHYNYSGLKGQTRVSRAGLHYLSNKVTIVFSSLSPEFSNLFLEAILSKDVVTLGNLYLEPESVEEEIIPEFGEETKYVCISPLILTDSDDPMQSKKFVHPADDHFSDLLFDAIIFRLEELGLYSFEKLQEFKKFQFIPDQAYIDKIQQSNKKYSRIYTIYDKLNNFEVRGYTLPFTLIAAPEIQDFVFRIGLGSFTNYGFGMLDLANADPLQRVKRKTKVQEKIMHSND